MKKKTARKSTLVKKSPAKKLLSKKPKFSLKPWLIAGVLVVVTLGIGYSLSQKNLTVLDIPGEVTDYIRANPIDINAINSGTGPISDDPYAAAAMAAAKTKVQQKTLAAQQAPKTEDAAARQRREAREEAEIEAAMAEAARQAAATALAVTPRVAPATQPNASITPKANIATEIDKIAEQAVKQVNTTTQLQLKAGSDKEYELKSIAPTNNTSGATINSNEKSCLAKNGASIGSGETVIGNIVDGKSEIRACQDGKWVYVCKVGESAGNQGYPCEVTVKPTYLQGENQQNCFINNSIVGHGTIMNNSEGKPMQCFNQTLREVVQVNGVYRSPEYLANLEKNCTDNGGKWSSEKNICESGVAESARQARQAEYYACLDKNKNSANMVYSWDASDEKNPCKAEVKLPPTPTGGINLKECQANLDTLRNKSNLECVPAGYGAYKIAEKAPTGGATKTECETNLATLSDKENKHCVAIGYGAYQIKDKPTTPLVTAVPNQPGTASSANQDGGQSVLNPSSCKNNGAGAVSVGYGYYVCNNSDGTPYVKPTPTATADTRPDPTKVTLENGKVGVYVRDPSECKYGHGAVKPEGSSMYICPNEGGLSTPALNLQVNAVVDNSVKTSKTVGQECGGPLDNKDGCRACPNNGQYITVKLPGSIFRNICGTSSERPPTAEITSTSDEKYTLKIGDVCDNSLLSKNKCNKCPGETYSNIRIGERVLRVCGPSTVADQIDLVSAQDAIKDKSSNDTRNILGPGIVSGLTCAILFPPAALVAGPACAIGGAIIGSFVSPNDVSTNLLLP